MGDSQILDTSAPTAVANFCSQEQEENSSVAHILLGNISIPSEMLSRFYPFMSEVVADANLNHIDFLLLQAYREEFENDFYMAIPTRFQRLPLKDIPEDFVESALQDFCVGEDLRKIMQHLQMSKARDGFFVKQLTIDQKMIHGLGDSGKKAGRWPFRR